MAAGLVRDIMTKDIIMIEASKTALEAAKLMAERGISSVFVLQEGNPAGILTERDFVKKVCARDLSVSKVKVADIMSKIMTTADPDTPIEVAIQRMTNHRIRRLPIMEDGKIVGIITVTDLAKHLRTTLLLESALGDTDDANGAGAMVDDNKQ
jgi:CBS domain-containing protein